MFIRRLAHMCRAFMRKDDGNFAMLAATLIPLTFAAGSFAIDFANIMSMKTRLQAAVDGAALATSSQLAEKKLSQADAKKYAEEFFKGMITEDSKAFSGYAATPTATITPIANGTSTIWKVEVRSVGSQQLTPLAQMVGKSKIDVTVSGVSQASAESGNPMSMFLVLDHSGSMGESSGQKKGEPQYCWDWWRRVYYDCTPTSTKLEVLKSAVGDLVSRIKQSDPDNKYARMGAVAYNDKTEDKDKLTADWNKDRVTTFANALVHGGGTTSTTAMQWAKDKILSTTEDNQHLSKHGSKDHEKFIVFMTDGYNTGYTRDRWGNITSEYQDTIADRDTKAACTAAKDKGVIIYSVAFQAPEAGKPLLQDCASSPAHYYDAKSADALIAAFKAIGEKATKANNRLTM